MPHIGGRVGWNPKPVPGGALCFIGVLVDSGPGVLVGLVGNERGGRGSPSN